MNLGCKSIVLSIFPFYFAVTISDLVHLAEDLRPHTIQTMKMEPAPWIRDYVKNMDDLYTELTLEKIDHKLFEEERVKLENYKELFASGMFEYLYIRYYIPEYLDTRYHIPSLKPKRKILIKGDPGMGKTSLVKKIAYDWAKGDFDEISIVLFVFVKLVKPGDLIENAHYTAKSNVRKFTCNCGKTSEYSGNIWS